MAFFNCHVSDSEIDTYELPFPKGKTFYWTRDAARHAFLWGGKGGNPAYGEDILGKFHFHHCGNSYAVTLAPGVGSSSYNESPYVIVWEKIISLECNQEARTEWLRVLPIFKEALVAYGEDGRENQFAPDRVIKMNF